MRDYNILLIKLAEKPEVLQPPTVMAESAKLAYGIALSKLIDDIKAAGEPVGLQLIVVAYAPGEAPEIHILETEAVKEEEQ